MSTATVTILRRLGILGKAKGATVASEATVTTVNADHNGLDVAVQGTLPLPTGAATSALQGTGNTSLASIDGKVTACNTGNVTVASCALPTGAATSAAQGTGNASLASIDGKITACNTGAVVVSSCALPTGAATETTLASVLAKLIAAPATEAKQDAGNTSLSTLAGVVSAGKALVTETSAAAILAKFSAGQAARASSLSVALSTEDAAKVPVLGQALAAGSSPVVLPSAQDVVAYAGSGGRVLTTEASGSTIATNTSTTATNTTTIAGAILATDTALSGGVHEIGGVGKDAAPTSVTDGRSVRAWFSRAGALMVDPIDRAARLLGAITGVNGTSIATGANPVPMQISSGSTLYTGATAALSLPIVFARSLSAVSATLAINGDVIKASSGSALWITITNTTGSSVYWQIFDLASGPPANGARAAASAPAITANNGSRSGDLIGPTLGLGCNTGILLVLSLSPATYSAVASNSCSYSIQYI